MEVGDNKIEKSEPLPKVEKSDKSETKKNKNKKKSSGVNGLTCLTFILENEPELLKLMPKCVSRKCYEFHIDDFIKNLKKATATTTLNTECSNSLCRKALLLINNAEMGMTMPPSGSASASAVGGEEDEIVSAVETSDSSPPPSSSSSLSKFQKKMIQQCNKLVRELLKYEAEEFVNRLVPAPPHLSKSKCGKHCKCDKDFKSYHKSKAVKVDSAEQTIALVDEVKIKIGLNMLGEILEGNCLLKDLMRVAKRMRKNNLLEAKELQAKLDAHTRKLQQYNLINYAKSNNTNIARFVRGSEYEAYQIQHPPTCVSSNSTDDDLVDPVNTTLLAICPRDIYQIGDLFYLVLKQEIPLMISLFCSTESNDKYHSSVRGKRKTVNNRNTNWTYARHNFWAPEVLRDVPLRKGWTFRSSIIQTIHSSPPRSFPDGSPMSKNYDIDEEDNNNADNGSDNDSPMEDDDSLSGSDGCSDDDPLSESDSDDDNNKLGDKDIVNPVLIETKLEFENVDGQKREIRHLHFNGWVDQTSCPDEPLANFLLDRIDELMSADTAPFQIGCHYSRSRSAVILICHLLRKQIRLELSESANIATFATTAAVSLSLLSTENVENKKESMSETSTDKSELAKIALASGVKSLGEISVNIPEMIFALRRQRHQFLRRPQQLINVYSITAAFYCRLRQIQHELRKVFELQNCLAFEDSKFVEFPESSSCATPTVAVVNVSKQQVMNCVLSYF